MTLILEWLALVAGTGMPHSGSSDNWSSEPEGPEPPEQATEDLLRIDGCCFPF